MAGIGLGVHLHSKSRPRFFHSYGVIELDAAITLLLAKVRCSPPVRQLSKSFLNRVFLICIRHELSGPVSSGPIYDYQCTMSRTGRATEPRRDSNHGMSSYLQPDNYQKRKGAEASRQASTYPDWRGR